MEKVFIFMKKYYKGELLKSRVFDGWSILSSFLYGYQYDQGKSPARDSSGEGDQESLYLLDFPYEAGLSEEALGALERDIF